MTLIEGLLDDDDLTARVAAMSYAERAAELRTPITPEELTNYRSLERPKMLFGPDFRLDLNPWSPYGAAGKALAAMEAETDATGSDEEVEGILERWNYIAPEALILRIGWWT